MKKKQKTSKPSRPQCSNKKQRKKQQQQNLTFISELHERKTDTDSTNKKPSLNQ